MGVVGILAFLLLLVVALTPAIAAEQILTKADALLTQGALQAAATATPP